MAKGQEKLFLLHAKSRLLYGGIQANEPSRFLSDIPDELKGEVGGGRRYVGSMPAKKAKIEVKRSIEEYKEGDKVDHKMFGKVDTYEEFKQNISRAGITGFVEPIRDTSENVAKGSLKNKFPISPEIRDIVPFP